MGDPEKYRDDLWKIQLANNLIISICYVLLIPLFRHLRYRGIDKGAGQGTPHLSTSSVHEQPPWIKTLFFPLCSTFSLNRENDYGILRVAF
jgi:hypothetical protein